MKKLTIALLVFLTSITSYAQDISGQWDGVLKVQGTQLRLVFHINKDNTGYTATMDSPDQNVKGVPVTTASFANSVLKLEIKNAKIEYEGTLNKDTIITGYFKQAGQSFPMNLRKSRTETNKTTSSPKVSDENFDETPIVLKTKTGDIFGTLTSPKKSIQTPLAIIIAGSGPTDRDCNNAMMKCDAFKKLAHELAANNIATLRYDKRGIAESQAAGKNESELRFDDYVNDVKGWIELMRQDKRFSEIILIGHSEGSLIGMIAAGKADKFISIAGPGQPAYIAIKEQLSVQSKEVQDLAFPALDSLAKGKIVENVSPSLNSLLRLSIQPYMISWFKYDPQIEIQKLAIPLLIIQGTNDIQVSVDDAKRLVKSNPEAELVLLDKMNHVLRTVEGDRQANIATYNNPSLPLANELVKNISSFILKN